MPLSSSNNSKISHDPASKHKKEVMEIVKKIKEMLKNMGKTIWDITSMSVPEFMDNHLIN
jgi:hypothetical protein